MASDDEEKYSLDDELDEFLAKDISPFVIYSKFSTFANALRVPKVEMDRITAPNAYQQDERVKEVSKALLYRTSFHTYGMFLWSQCNHCVQDAERFGNILFVS